MILDLLQLKNKNRLLLVGACLQCHKDNSKVMKRTLNFGLDSILKNISKECIIPSYTN